MAITRISVKIFILVTNLFLLFTLTSSIRNQRWEDIMRWDGASNTIFDVPDSKEQKMLDDYDCSTIGQCDLDKYNKESIKMIETNELPLKRMKSNTGLSSWRTFDKLLQIDDSKPGAASGIVPYFHTSLVPLPCSCGSHYRLINLGRAYVPRYLVTAVCDADACGATGAYKCRQRSYTVRVLKKKDAGNAHPPELEPDQVNNPPLPESLRKEWKLETFTVTVACECGAEKI